MLMKYTLYAMRRNIGTISYKDTFSELTLAPHQLGLVVAPLEKHAQGVLTYWTRSQLASTLGEIQTYVSTLNYVTENLSGLALKALSVVFLPGKIRRLRNLCCSQHIDPLRGGNFPDCPLLTRGNNSRLKFDPAYRSGRRYTGARATDAGRSSAGPPRTALHTPRRLAAAVRCPGPGRCARPRPGPGPAPALGRLLAAAWGRRPPTVPLRRTGK